LDWHGRSGITIAPRPRRRQWLGWAAALALAGAGVPARAALPPHEAMRVERLLTMIATLSDMRFIRNGREYDCDTAVTFLRGKLNAYGDTLSTAEEFIDRLATRSSTTGEPYRIRRADGREVGAGEFLRTELARLDKAARRRS
jgi:hypothetical protein